jgi:hypothetical protein
MSNEKDKIVCKTVWEKLFGQEENDMNALSDSIVDVLMIIYQ